LLSRKSRKNWRHFLLQIEKKILLNLLRNEKRARVEIEAQHEVELLKEKKALSSSKEVIRSSIAARIFSQLSEAKSGMNFAGFLLEHGTLQQTAGALSP
jgi:hypothetical protein